MKNLVLRSDDVKVLIFIKNDFIKIKQLMKYQLCINRRMFKRLLIYCCGKQENNISLKDAIYGNQINLVQIHLDKYLQYTPEFISPIYVDIAIVYRYSEILKILYNVGFRGSFEISLN